MATKKKKSFNKSIKIYFSMLKKIPNPSAYSPNLLSACKYPKTPSFSLNRTSAGAGGGAAAGAATLSDVDRFLHENFQSLYPPPPPPETSGEIAGDGSSSPEPSSPTSICGEGAAVSGGGVAVMTFSKDPYEDFRRSMEEMMGDRHVDGLEPLDWDFMEEILLSFLELNERGVHKYILRAFTDVTASFRRREEERRVRVPARRRRVGGTEAVAVAERRFPAGR